MSTVTTSDETAAVDEPVFPRVRSKRGEPTWELAERYPRQGEWTEEDYFALEADYFVEFVDGVLEFLPMPKLPHQRIAKFLLYRLDEFVTEHDLGEVDIAPLPVKLFEGRIREPDVVYMNWEQIEAAEDAYPNGADLVVEVVSADDESRKRDLKDKPLDYAKAGVKEYWIVDPQMRTIKVLTLSRKKYKTHGEFRPGQTATSALLDGFSVSVDDVFAASRKPAKPASKKDNGK
jgi:Uma2 family endonuclease